MVVELDGGQHSERIEYDAARTEALERAGFHVMRFWNNQVLTNPDGVIRSILEVLQLARP